MAPRYRKRDYQGQADEFMRISPVVIDQCAARALEASGGRTPGPESQTDATIAELLEAFRIAGGSPIQDMSAEELGRHLEDLAAVVDHARSSLEAYLIRDLQYRFDEFTARPFDHHNPICRPELTVRAYAEATKDVVICFAIMWKVGMVAEFIDPFRDSPGLRCFSGVKEFE